LIDKIESKKNSLLKQKILTGANELSVIIDDQQAELLLRYLLLFEKWNKAYNLSAIRDVDRMVSRHLLDSLAVVSHIQGSNIIDVGTGGGLPGIPLAILFPEKNITLLDSNGKKTRFLFQVITELKLKNATVHNSRVEKFQPIDKFDGVVSRAFASLKDMTNYCHHLLEKDGFFYAMKGVYPTEELKELDNTYEVCRCLPLQVPQEEGERHLILIRSVASLDPKEITIPENNCLKGS
jgi:16S rRNA (guanine527-N7)-methyltransferase